MNTSTTRLRCDRTPVWASLQAAYDTHGRTFDLRQAFAADPQRFAHFSQQAPHVFGDLSKNLLDTATAQLLLDLAEQCGVKNGYQDPAQLGADRWAGLIGAHRLHEGACLVVNAGTATTIDVLDAGGVFQGGVILPGVYLMRRALAGNTAQLLLTAGEYKALPRNTADAIASGCLLASAAAIERMFVRVSGQSGAVCLLSGGAADSLSPLLDIPLLRIDNLVLEGLACIGLAAGE